MLLLKVAFILTWRILTELIHVRWLPFERILTGLMTREFWKIRILVVVKRLLRSISGWLLGKLRRLRWLVPRLTRISFRGLILWIKYVTLILRLSITTMSSSNFHWFWWILDGCSGDTFLIKGASLALIPFDYILMLLKSLHIECAIKRAMLVLLFFLFTSYWISMGSIFLSRIWSTVRVEYIIHFCFLNH